MSIKDEDWYRLSPAESWFKCPASEQSPLTHNITKNYGSVYRYRLEQAISVGMNDEDMKRYINAEEHDEDYMEIRVRYGLCG